MVNPTGPRLRQNCKPCLSKSEMMPEMALGKLVFRWPRITPLALAERGERRTIERILDVLRRLPLTYSKSRLSIVQVQMR